MKEELPEYAISVQQPWAWLIVNGLKDVENRTWATKFRGPVAIHAGMKVDAQAVRNLRAQGFELPEVFQVGGIVGEASIVDCVSKYPSEWFVGPYGFVLTDRKKVEFVPCRGRLQFFKWAAAMPATKQVSLLTSAATQGGVVEAPRGAGG